MNKLLFSGMLVVILSSCSYVDKDPISTGIIRIQSPYPVAETTNRLEKEINAKGLNLFARIDHAKNAQGVDMALAPTELLIFGNPKAGTKLMQCAQETGLDLPQKILITEDNEQRTWVSYNDPNYLKMRHNIQGCDNVIGQIAQLLQNLSVTAVESKN